MTGTFEIVIFGIKAGARLVEQGRRAYVEATIDRGLTLPLPEFSKELSVGNADDFFYGEGNGFVKRMARVAELYEISNRSALSNEEKAEYLDLFADCRIHLAIEQGKETGESISLSRDSLVAIAGVRQWAASKRPFPSAAQRVIGTLIEIGVDYAVKTKGLIDERSSEGRALKGFLSAIDDIKFSGKGVEEIAGSLFVALLETVEKNPALLRADKKTEKLVLAVTQGLMSDMQKWMDALAATDLGKRASVKEWGQLIFRSVLTSAAETVLSDQEAYFGWHDEEGGKVVRTISLSLLDLVTADEALDFTRIFSRSGLEKISKAALAAVAEAPGIFGIDHEGFRLIIQQTAKDLSELPELYSAGVLSEAVRIIIEKTARNSELLWPAEFRKDPAKHLLVTAAKETMLALSRKVGDKTEGAFLTAGDAVAVMEAVTDEVVQNPDWLLDAAGGEGTLLRDALTSALAAMKKVPGNRLDSTTLKSVLCSVLRAVALRKEFLDPLPIGSSGRNAISEILGIVVDTAFADTADAKAAWVLARNDIFCQLSAAVLLQAATMGVSEKDRKKIGDVLDRIAKKIAAGSVWSKQSMLDEIRSIS